MQRLGTLPKQLPVCKNRENAFSIEIANPPSAMVRTKPSSADFDREYGNIPETCKMYRSKCKILEIQQTRNRNQKANRQLYYNYYTVLRCAITRTQVPKYAPIISLKQKHFLIELYRFLKVELQIRSKVNDCKQRAIALIV